MTDANSTIRVLAEITDAGLFERLVTAVLRSADPDVYRNLCHPGVGYHGKTVKAPLDNIGWAHLDSGERVVAVAHSTCEGKDIFGKWLHDPSTVKSRKPGAKPTAPEGDLRKAIREIQGFRADRPGLRATFALTSNREPDQESVVAAQKLAADAGIDLDIWSASRLARYLDDTDRGQWLRRTHLGAPVQLVSIPLLHDCAQRQIDEYFHLVNPTELIERSLPSQRSYQHTLLIGPSGIGKTTMAMQMLKAHLDSGGIGLVITHETLAIATTLDEAIDIELRKLEPELRVLSGHRALAFASDIHPFLVLVEDANRASDPAMIFNKVLSWALRKSSGTNGITANWRLVCPIWPRYLDALDRKSELSKGTLLYTLGSYSDREAANAVRRRANIVGLNCLPGEITSIAKALGNDPLLIALHDFTGPPSAPKVVDAYVERELAKAASVTPDFMYSDLEEAVNLLARQMLMRRILTPSWREISEWLQNEPEHLKALRLVFKAGSVLRLQQRDSAEVLIPRHDRVLLSILSRAVAQDLCKHGFNTPYLADPFFSEAVGVAALNAKLGDADLQRLMQVSPLALFYAFELAVRSKADRRSVVNVLYAWLVDEATHEKKFQSVRFHATKLLAEIDAQEVLSLSDLFRNGDRFYDWCKARFRNGDLSAGLSLLSMHSDFGIRIAGQKGLLEHIFARYGKGIVDALRDVLTRTDLNDRACRGALYLAGYMGDPTLASAICSRWQSDNPEKRDLEAYLWASARCYDEGANNALPLICDEWAALPDDEAAERTGDSRSDLAAHGISWEFRDYPPVAAIPYFVQRANSDPRLSWPITYMLREIDHPLAVEHVVRYIAQHDHFITAHFLLDGWERRQQEHGIQMSNVAKEHLLELVFDSNNELPLRKAAFRAWEASFSPTDLAAINQIGAGHELYERAIWARARRGDKAVIPELLQVIPTNARYWWQTGRYLWSEDMTVALHKSIQDFVTDRDTDGKDSSSCESILSERLMELDAQSAERILVQEWGGLKSSPSFVQAALYHCTPRLTELARSAIAQSAEPEELLKFVTMHMGWKIKGRKGIFRIEQVQLLASYAHLLSDGDLYDLWTICNEHGWIEVRKRYLDEGVSRSERLRKSVDTEIDFSDLDRLLQGVAPAGLTHWWFDQHLRVGRSHMELMDALFDWLQRNKSSHALDIVSEIFHVSAGRADLERLQRFTESWPEVTEVMQDLAFSIRRRTLH